MPIILDRAYRFSIHFTGTKLYFSCQDTVTGKEDILSYEIPKATAVYEPYEEHMSLRSRVYGDATGGYMAVEFDDVYVDVAEPPAVYDATGDWEITDSDPWSELGCDLPDDDSTTDVTITQTQNGNDFTLVAHTDEGDFTFDGVVHGESYYFLSDVETEVIGRSIMVFSISLKPYQVPEALHRIFGMTMSISVVTEPILR